MRLVELPELGQCCVCGARVTRGFILTAEGMTDEPIGWCDVDWQREVRYMREKGVWNAVCLLAAAEESAS